MVDTNYITSLVKILETPKKKVLKKNLLFTKFRVQLPQARGNKLISLTFWGNLAQDVAKYYTINDYIIIEGYISLRNDPELSFKNPTLKKVEVNALRAYPFFLNYNCSNVKY